MFKSQSRLQSIYNSQAIVVLAINISGAIKLVLVLTSNRSDLFVKAIFADPTTITHNDSYSFFVLPLNSKFLLSEDGLKVTIAQMGVRFN